MASERVGWAVPILRVHAIFAVMPAPNILVIVVDGLRASALGAYGNTSFPTPALDRFAADSFLLDWCYASSVDLAEIYRDLWQSDSISLPRQLKSSGYKTTLVTDAADLASFPAANEFDHRLQLSDKSTQDANVLQRVVDTSHTAFARLFASASDLVASSTASPQFVWVHARGMYGPWDAPLELQQSLLDEDDPLPVEAVTPPDFVMAESDDPDAAFRYACAYAAQAMVLDECCEALLAAVDSLDPADRWLISLIGARGYPLGEHRRVGGIDPRLYGEQLHVPWLIRFPDNAGRLGRSGQLTSHTDLAPSLLDSASGTSVRALSATAHSPWRDALLATSAAGHRAIRTTEWCLRQKTDSQGDQITTELFVRPDDRWETNDVAKLCSEVVETLTIHLDGFHKNDSSE